MTMTADEIINYFLQNTQSSLTTPNTSSLCQSTIENWICINVGNNVLIRGQIHNHPKYPPGTPFKTSPIQGYFSNCDRIYVNTRNSMYELGMPHQNFAGDSQSLLSNDEEMQSKNLNSLGE